MPLDYPSYQQYVDHFDLSEEHKIELIEIIARMMASFVDRAFGEASEQLLPGKTRKKCSAAHDGGIESDLHLLTNFNNAADQDCSEKGRP